MSKKIAGVGRYLFAESDAFSSLVTAWCVVSMTIALSWLTHEDAQVSPANKEYLNAALIKPENEQNAEKGEAKKAGFAAMFSKAGEIMKERRENKQRQIEERAEQYGLKINVKQPEAPKTDIAAPEVRVQDNKPQEAPKKSADEAVFDLMNQ